MSLVLVGPESLKVKNPYDSDKIEPSARKMLREDTDKDPYPRLVLEALAREDSLWEFPSREEVAAFVLGNPMKDLQTMLKDGGPVPEGHAWFFARREGRQEFDEPWAVSERLGPLPWLLKSRNPAS